MSKVTPLTPPPVVDARGARVLRRGLKIAGLAIEDVTAALGRLKLPQWKDARDLDEILQVADPERAIALVRGGDLEGKEIARAALRRRAVKVRAALSR